MSSDDFTRRVEALWAEHFGCSADDFDVAGTTLLPRQRLRGDNVLHMVYIRRRALAEIDPALEARTADVLRAPSDQTVLSSRLLKRAWGAHAISDVDAGLIFHLRPGELVRRPIHASCELRSLERADEPALQGLKHNCTGEEVEEAFVDLDHELAWGCFSAGRLVAAGSAYRRNGFMDYGVLTHPEFRGRELARHILAALVDDTVPLGLIPQYRCNRENQPSRRVAEAAGFRLLFATESVKLAA